jgi:cell division protein FtsQ
MIRRSFAVFAIVALLTAGVFTWFKFDRPIDTIVIEGDLTEAEQGVMQQRISGLGLPGILSLNLSSFEAQLQEMDWARRVDVRRRWPNKLVIYVYKESPVAQWNDYTFLSADGAILELPDQYDQLPRLSAELSSPRESMEIFRLLQQYAARQDLSILELNENAQGEWQLGFESGTILRLGAEDLEARMNRFLSAYASIIKQQQRPVAYVDARYPSGIAVRYSEIDVAKLDALGGIQAQNWGQGMVGERINTNSNDGR